MTEGSLGSRFALIRADIGAASAKAMSKHLGIGEKLWKLYEEEGGTPGWATLQKLTDLGYNVVWLMTGQGEMKLDRGQLNQFPVDEEFWARVLTDSPERDSQIKRVLNRSRELMSEDSGSVQVDFGLSNLIEKIRSLMSGTVVQPSVPVDEMFMARIAVAVADAYAEARQPISDARKGQEIHRMLTAILSGAQHPEEYEDQLEIERKRLRRRLAEAAAAPGQGKASA